MEIICKSLFVIAFLLAIIVTVSGVIYVVVNNFSLIFVVIFVFVPICTNILGYFIQKIDDRW